MRRNWDEIKRTTEGRGAGGLFGDVPENLPARRCVFAASESAGAAPDGGEAIAGVTARADALGVLPGPPESFEAIGELLFAVVACARTLDVDAELALRQATTGFRERVESQP